MTRRRCEPLRHALRRSSPWSPTRARASAMKMSACAASRVRSLQNNMNERAQKRELRKRRIRARIFGTALRPRLAVFRSNKHLYAQLIDDSAGRTIAEAHDSEVPKAGKARDTRNANCREGSQEED